MSIDRKMIFLGLFIVIGIFLYKILDTQNDINLNVQITKDNTEYMKSIFSGVDSVTEIKTFNQ